MNDDRAKLKLAKLEGFEKEDPLLLSLKMLAQNQISKCSKSSKISVFNQDGVDKKCNINDFLM